MWATYNAFKNGKDACNWDIKKLLSAMYNIFHESPSRRADNRNLTSASFTDNPLKFCSH